MGGALNLFRRVFPTTAAAAKTRGTGISAPKVAKSDSRLEKLVETRTTPPSKGLRGGFLSFFNYMRTTEVSEHRPFAYSMNRTFAKRSRTLVRDEERQQQIASAESFVANGVLIVHRTGSSVCMCMSTKASHFGLVKYNFVAHLPLYEDCLIIRFGDITECDKTIKTFKKMWSTAKQSNMKKSIRTVAEELVRVTNKESGAKPSYGLVAIDLGDQSPDRAVVIKSNDNMCYCKVVDAEKPFVYASQEAMPHILSQISELRSLRDIGSVKLEMRRVIQSSARTDLSTGGYITWYTTDDGEWYSSWVETKVKQANWPLRL